MINCLHHFEILTNTSTRLLKYLIDGFDFKLVKSTQNENYKQYLVRNNSINYLISSIDSSSSSSSSLSVKNTLKLIENKNATLFEHINEKQNTIFNAAFQVKDIDKIIQNCKQHNVRILNDKEFLFDKKYGYVEYALIESCINGVVHSLIDLKDYKGSFLPGFETNQTISSSNLLTHFDHLTYAIERNSSPAIIEWYHQIFKMKRFILKNEQENNEGLVVKTGNTGMNLKCINYWLCAETGVEFNESKSDFKFVISEPLEDNSSINQITIFLNENKGPGIQHIGMNSTDIFQTVKNSKLNNLDIQYYVAPNEYYDDIDKKIEAKNCGLNINDLKNNHILLDSEQDLNEENKKNFLLQVFTQPIFNKNTVFFELIQRVGNVKGFGAGNIKALWKAVQNSICPVRNKLKI